MKKKINYTTRTVYSPAVTFNEVLDAVKKITPSPIKEIKVGCKFYDDLLEYTKHLHDVNSNKNKLYLGSLYGVKILIDPELKPNEYRVVTNSEES